MAITTHTLKNGMQVLLEENHAAKVVSFQALVKVGSACETDAEAGICHVIEHMLFKGTPTRPTGTIARDVEAAGGDINAYTSLDQTVFYINMATQFKDKGLEILADAVRNPLFDAGELAREAEVILEEIRREHDNPGRMVTEHLFNASFKTHPYGRPIIGFPETVKSFTHEQLLDFHRRWYTPRNIAFIAVGDFDSARMLREIERSFDGFEGGMPPALALPSEPAHTTPGVAIHEMNVQSAYLSLGFNVPQLTHEDTPAMDVLSHIMGGTDSSRLEQEIKEKQKLVHNIYSFAFTPRHPGLWVIGAMLGDRDVPRALGAICGEVQKIMSEPVTSGELARAKLNIRSNEIYEKETVGGQAGKIASFLATADDHRFEERYYQMLSGVSAASAREAAERYLNPANCTISLIVPNGSRFAARPDEIRRAAEGKAGGTRRAPRVGREGVRRQRLKNGARLQILENHSVPVVALCAAAMGGVRYETRATNGLSTLMSRSMTKGTSGRSAVEIAKEIERIAGNIDGFSGRNSTGVRCEFLSEFLHDGFSLFSEVLMHPAFSPSEVAREKRVLLKAIKDQEDSLTSLAFIEFAKALFPKHPYGLRQLGSIQAVRGLTSEKLKRFHRQTVCAEELVITVAGDVSAREVEELVEHHLADLPRRGGPAPGIRPDEVPDEPRETVITKKEKEQAHIVVGFQGTTVKGRDRYAMAVLNNVLAGQGGRLFLTLRDRMSLAYAVSSVHYDGIEPGYFAVYIGTDPGKVETAKAAILDQLSAICHDKADYDELARSRQYIVGTYELDLQRNGSLASIHTFNTLYGLGPNEVERYPSHIMEVTADDVLRVAKKYIRPEAYVMAVVKPA
ncbi:MAG: insulinase family protein [Proteobacteria bacterium]|nr:insulinase family protein [Pseudomonadota bacterium]